MQPNRKSTSDIANSCSALIYLYCLHLEIFFDDQFFTVSQFWEIQLPLILSLCALFSRHDLVRSIFEKADLYLYEHSALALRLTWH